jgi:predicted ribosomally synthesized peptide with SipW-like signal peptide
MRFLCFLFLVLFAGAVGTLAYWNQQEVTLRFLNWSGPFMLPLVIGAAYLLGMLSGWTVVGMLRRSIRRVTGREQTNSG